MNPTEITALRTARGWTKTELARRLHVNWTTVWRWELGKMPPSEGHVLRMRRWEREAQRRKKAK